MPGIIMHPSCPPNAHFAPNWWAGSQTGGVCQTRWPRQQPRAVVRYRETEHDSEQFRSGPRTSRLFRRQIPRQPKIRSREQPAEAGADMEGQNKRLTPCSTRGSGKLEDGIMSTSDGVQKRNAFAACTAFRIEGLEASLDHAREIAVREELEALGRCIEEAQGYLAQIRVLHQEALDEFSGAQGE